MNRFADREPGDHPARQQSAEQEAADDYQGGYGPEPWEEEDYDA